MKKFFMAACALAVMGFVACSKDDNATVNNEVKVNFTVADKPSFEGTRAAKTAWANGDKIMVVFSVPEHSGIFETENILTLTYNGTWTASDISSFVSTLETSGSFKAFHYRADELGFTTVGEKTIFKNYKGGDFLQFKGTYTLSGSELTLTEEIKMAFYGEDVFQVSVKGLDQSKTWKMSVAYNNQWETASTNNQYIKWTYFGENSVYLEDNSLPKLVDKTVQHQSWGVNNSDGDVAFWVSTANSQPSQYIMFHIESDDQIYRYTLKYDENTSLKGGKHYRLSEITDDYSFQGFYDWNHQKWGKKN